MKGEGMDKVREALDRIEHLAVATPAMSEVELGAAMASILRQVDAAREALSVQPAGVSIEDILAEFDKRAAPGGGFYEPQEPAEIIRAMLAGTLAEYDQSPATQPAPSKPAAWVACAERMPASGVTVLACYTNSAGNVRRIRAEWVAAKTIESDADSEISEYDEATDCYYDPEGWYEKIDNWGDYSSVAVVEGEITHWMPLPAAPHPAAKGGAE